jgi:hypothetical protein
VSLTSSQNRDVTFFFSRRWPLPPPTFVSCTS